MGPSLYDALASSRPYYGLSEHLFSVDIYGVDALDSDAFIRKLIDDFSTGNSPEMSGIPNIESNSLIRARDEVIPKYLDRLCDRILGSGPTVVGFTTTFNQTMSSLALARRIKKRAPDVRTILGGASVHGVMGSALHGMCSSYVDHVFLGEAEIAFGEYIQRLKNGIGMDGIPGMSYADGPVPDNRIVTAMDEVPMPDYSDYLSEIGRVKSELGLHIDVNCLPFEMSRGCWWGMRKQCKFCGNEPDSITFRAKSVKRAVSEIIRLSAINGINRLAATDWILRSSDVEEFLRELTSYDLDIFLFFEVRPSGMKKYQLKMMRDAGIVRVQPGIESFSTPFLRLLNKDMTGLGQIQFLRWCREIGIDVGYNLLYRMPGEKEEWYSSMIETISKIHHLQPPTNPACIIELMRYSPMFDRREECGIDSFSPREDYNGIFPLADGPRLEDIGYFFAYESKKLADPSIYAEFVSSVWNWIDDYNLKRPRYEYSIGPGFTRIIDTRKPDARVITLRGMHQDVLLLCDSIQTMPKLIKHLTPVYGEKSVANELGGVIAELVDIDVLIRDGERLLSLPIGCKYRATEELIRYVKSG